MDQIRCSHCVKNLASKFLVSPGGAHIPLCNGCVRKVKTQMAKTRVKLRKSGHLDSIDPQFKKWLQNPEITTSSDEFKKQKLPGPSSSL